MESTIEEGEEVMVTNPGGNVVIVETLGVSADKIDCTLRRDRTETETGTDGNDEREHDRQPEYER